MIPVQSPSTVAVALRGVVKRYGRGALGLDNVSLEVARGAFLAVMGPSGSGKSTLLHCASGLETPTSGTVVLAGRDLAHLNETRRTELRRDHVGFVFQSYNLPPSLTVEQNLTLPTRLAGRVPDRTWLHTLVERMGLTAQLGRRPAELSGGQQQRAAIVRALASRPEVIFADEPTGALDVHTAREVLRHLRELVDDLEQTVVMVTHDPAAAAYADDALVMLDGRVRDVVHNPAADELANRMAHL